MEKVISKKESYTVASAFPVKVAINRDLINSIVDKGIIAPIHVQLIPTNECNLNCDFCSCSNRRITEHIPIEKLEYIVKRFKEAGMNAVTITGGGEPLLYPYVDRMLQLFFRNHVQIGLVTNGTQFNSVHLEILNIITWCRISHSDKRVFNSGYWNYLDKVITRSPDVDWAFSIVVSGEDNDNQLANVGQVVKFANAHNFTHIRLVPDLYKANDIDLNLYRLYLLQNRIDDNLVIYQNRNDAVHGGDCYIGFLKPIVDADGKVYTCCGAQYALPDPEKQRYMPEELCFGDIDEFLERIKASNMPFDGSICTTCYYMNYNNLLDAMVKVIDHKEFV